MKFYICNHCKNVIVKVSDHGVPVFCCGEPMKELIPNTTDAATEKHVPIVEVKEDRVDVLVGSTLHPMTAEHLIEWVVLETDKGHSIHYLTDHDEPKASFCLNGAKPVAVYEYCNLHGVWKKDL